MWILLVVTLLSDGNVFVASQEYKSQAECNRAKNAAEVRLDTDASCTPGRAPIAD